MSYQVKILRLLGNQDVIAKVEKKRQDGRVVYRLTDILSLMVIPEEAPASALAPNPTAQQPKLKVQFYPFVAIYMDTKRVIELDQFHVLFATDPVPGILDYYNRQTSGLILPQTDNSVKSSDLSEVSEESTVENDVVA